MFARSFTRALPCAHPRASDEELIKLKGVTAGLSAAGSD